MAQSRDESPPSRIELVVLACLSQKKPPSDDELGEAVQQLALPRQTPDVARRRALELLDGLVGRALVTSDSEPPARGRKRSGALPRRLTESGQRALRKAFSQSHTPTWAQVRDRHLPALALGMPPGSNETSKAPSESALMAAVLCARFGIRDAATSLAVCDAVIARALGMPAGKLSLDLIRAHVLRRGIDEQWRDAPSPDAKSYAGKLGAWIAYEAVGADGEQRKMARALARRWVCGEATPLRVSSAHASSSESGASTAVAAASTAAAASSPQPTAPSPQPTANPPPSSGRDARTPLPKPPGEVRSPPAIHTGAPTRPPLLGGRSAQSGTPNLLDAVRETIPRVGAEGRFGEKVYVSAIWRNLARDRRAGDLSLDHFKDWLVRANRDGWLVLARADLIGAMDAKQVNESEINDRGATFHFVLDQRNGASVSRQENHAR